VSTTVNKKGADDDALISLLNHSFLATHLELGPLVRETVAQVVAKNPRALRRWCKGPKDAVNDLFLPLFLEVLSPNRAVLVDLESWNTIVERQKISSWARFCEQGRSGPPGRNRQGRSV